MSSCSCCGVGVTIVVVGAVVEGSSSGGRAPGMAEAPPPPPLPESALCPVYRMGEVVPTSCCPSIGLGEQSVF